MNFQEEVWVNVDDSESEVSSHRIINENDEADKCRSGGEDSVPADSDGDNSMDQNEEPQLVKMEEKAGEIQK